MDDKFKRLQELVKCGIYLNINAHRDMYEDIHKFLEDSPWYDDISPEAETAMIDADTIVSLQVYPSTPIGSYKVFDITIEGVLDQMLDILESL